MHILCLIMYKVRSENGYGFLRPGLKTGVGNGIFWSEIWSGFGDVGGTPPPKIPESTPSSGPVVQTWRKQNGRHTQGVLSLRLVPTASSLGRPVR